MYKIETHLHTTHTSKCGHLTAPVLAKAYKEAGYDAIAVTDHYNRDTVKYLNLDLTRTDGLLEKFLDGFHRMEDACGEAAVPENGGIPFQIRPFEFKTFRIELA